MEINNIPTKEEEYQAIEEFFDIEQNFEKYFKEENEITVLKIIYDQKKIKCT